MNKPVLLIVDDDPQVLAAVRRDLRARYREHYTVIGAASGPEALSTAQELKSRGDSLAMLISDQRMPGMLGSELLAAGEDDGQGVTGVGQPHAGVAGVLELDLLSVELCAAKDAR